MTSNRKLTKLANLFKFYSQHQTDVSTPLQTLALCRTVSSARASKVKRTRIQSRDPARWSPVTVSVCAAPPSEWSHSASCCTNQRHRQTCWEMTRVTKKQNKKLSYRRDSARCKTVKRSFKVVRCCANRRGIYDFRLALNSNLDSIFNCSSDIVLSLHIHIAPLFQVKLEKGGWK